MRPIDADVLEKKLKQHHDFFVNAWGGFGNLPIKDKARVDEITHCIAEVRNAPTIEAEPVRHGRWIFKDDDGAYPWTTKAICSECKEVIAWNSSLALENRQIEFAEKNHYCPNCGAKMDIGVINDAS